MTEEATLSVTIPSTSTAKDEKKETFTVYDVVITLGVQEWRTSIRYNTFRELHHAIKAKYSIRMPKMPGKKAFGNDQKTFIEKRRVGLQLYLQELLSYDEVRQSEEVAAILKLGGRIVDSSPPVAAVEEEAIVERGRALYDFVAEENDSYPQIPLKVGDIILIIDRSDADGSGWWYGENAQGKQGYFPGRYLELLPPPNKPLIGSMAILPKKTTAAPLGGHSTSPNAAGYSMHTTPELRRGTTPPNNTDNSNQGYPTASSSKKTPPVVPPRGGGSSSQRGPSASAERKDSVPLSPRGTVSKAGYDVDKDALNPNRLRKVEPPVTFRGDKNGSKGGALPGSPTFSTSKSSLVKGVSSINIVPKVSPTISRSASVMTLAKGAPGEKVDSRTLIATEILTTERAYVEQLKWLVNDYMAKLNEISTNGHSALNKKIIKDIFSNVEIILNLNTELLGQIEQRLGSWNNDTSLIGDLFCSWAPYLKMYKDYGSNFEIANDTCTKLREHATIANALEECKNRCQQLTIEALLITPIQRLPRYNLLLEDLLRNTPEKHPDAANLAKAVGVMKSISDELNESIRQSEQQRKFGDLAQGEGFKPLLEASRRLLLEAKFPLLKSKGKKDTNWHLFLFNDKIVPAKASRGALNPAVIVPLNLAWINDLKDKDKDKESAFEILTPEGPYVFAASSEQEKEKWLQKMRDAIQNNLQDKSLPIEQRVGDYAYTISSHEGSKYIGYWFLGKRHGNGTMHYFNGNQYVGEWEHDNRSGQGCLTYKTGQIYDGEWKDDKPHGYGVLVYNDGSGVSSSRYEGQFVAGLREGKGVFQFTNGDAYDGEWVADRAEGTGKLTFRDGSYYEGQFEENKRHGSGVFVAVDGSTYSGKWESGRRHGRGAWDDQKGNSYDGEWHDDRKHGTGTHTDASGNVYKGEWVKDSMEGKGVYTSASGDTYEGTWKDHKRNGYGTYTSADGYRYEGEWANGRKHGKGVLAFPSGDKYEGPFVADKPHGTGLFIRHDGAKLEGKWIGGVRDGRFAITYSEDGKPASFGGMCKDNTVSNSMDKHFELPPVAPDFNYFG